MRINTKNVRDHIWKVIWKMRDDIKNIRKDIKTSNIFHIDQGMTDMIHNLGHVHKLLNKPNKIHIHIYLNWFLCEIFVIQFFFTSIIY